jgi:hypothetical protein
LAIENPNEPERAASLLRWTQVPAPGSHHPAGVLFLDEYTEFRREVVRKRVLKILGPTPWPVRLLVLSAPVRWWWTPTCLDAGR